MHEKKSHTERNGKTRTFRYHSKGLTGYSSPVVLVKWKNQSLYRVCSDFWILNEKFLKINHAFPLVRNCIE